MTSALTDHVVALWRLQSRYADIVTRRAWPELGEVFRADTTVHIDTVTPSATGRLFMCEVRHDAASDTWQNAHGVYRDRYVLEDGRWWFAERRYRSMARSGPGGVVLGLPPGFA